MESNQGTTEKDIFRDTRLRLLGYANEVGESFRPLIHVNFVRLSYVIASGYVMADTFHKSEKAFKTPWKSKEIRRQQVTKAAVDTLVWQGFASIIIPGYTINRICWLSLKVLARRKDTAAVSDLKKPWETMCLFDPHVRIKNNKLEESRVIS